MSGEEAGQTDGEMVGGVHLVEREALLGIPDGLTHGDDEVRDGSAGSIHEAQPTHGDRHVCNELGVERDGRALGEPGKEITHHGILWPRPATPVPPEW